VAGHVVGAFAGVLKPRGVFGYEAVEEFMEIVPCGGIGVFHDDETATGVADEDMDGALLNAAGFENTGDAIRDLNGAFATGVDVEGLVTDTKRHYLGNWNLG
jgi:hypothetical protein